MVHGANIISSVFLMQKRWLHGLKCFSDSAESGKLGAQFVQFHQRWAMAGVIRLGQIFWLHLRLTEICTSRFLGGFHICEQSLTQHSRAALISPASWQRFARLASV